MLFAAGLGTRLKPFTDSHPKALAMVNGKTLLQHNIEYLQKYGITDVVINVHHFADQIEETIKNNKGWGSMITISDERDVVLETGGGLKHASGYFKWGEPFLVMNVDVLTSLNLGEMIEFHLDKEAIATLAIMDRPSSRKLLFNDKLQLCGWKNTETEEEKISRNDKTMKPYAFSGIQILSPSILSMPFTGKFSIIDVYLHFTKIDIIMGYDHTGDTFIDVGKPESIEKAESLF